MIKSLSIGVLLCLNLICTGQILYHSDLYRGGVTGSGFALAFGSNGSSSFNVNIPTTSTIKKAFLISGRNGIAPDLTIDFAGNQLIFDSTNQVGITFQSFFGGNSSVHIIDVSTFVTPSINQYPIIISTIQQGSLNRHNEFYLYILYEESSFPIINTYLYLNNQDFGFVNYNISNISPINNVNDVGLSLLTGYICDTNLVDGENVFIDGNFVGLIGGNDLNSGSCGGPYGDFYYENNQLFGLSDDTANFQMKGTDVLLNINSIINPNATNFSLNCTPKQTLPPNNSNNIWAFFLTYTTPCDTFTTTITTNDTICLGESIQLNATGGVQYSWFGAFEGLSDTSIANPMASPPQTTTYIVTIKNDSGCVKTEQVKIWVNPLPVADTLIVTNNFCGDSVGSLQVGAISNGGQPYLYSLTNLQTGNTQNSSLTTFNSLGTANYQLTITDINGCTFTDTATITETNIVQANFTATPSSGVAPLLVEFDNTSLNANAFQWSITSLPFGSAQGALDTLVWIPACAGNAAACGLQYEFINSGTYQACLIAYNNIPTCADTICKTIIVSDEISFVIPNVFTPNFDNENDNFVIQLTGASLIKTLKVEVFNRWGETLRSVEFREMGVVNSQNTLPTTQYTIWDGRTTAAEIAPDGTYFYVISYIKDDASATLSTRKGSITLLR